MRMRFAALMTLVGTLVTLSLASAQPNEQPPKFTLPNQGTELIRGLLHFHKVTPLSFQALPSEDPQDVIVIVHGLPRLSDPRAKPAWEATRSVLRGGGAVLILAEEQADLAKYFPHPTGLVVTGERVYDPNPESNYRKIAECPIVVAQKPSELDMLLMKLNQPVDASWTLFAGQRVATNLPGALRVTQSSKYCRNVLARFPKGCTIDHEDGPSLAADRLFAVAGTGDGSDIPFRSLIIADPSILSNQMMVAGGEAGGDPAASNLAFANTLVPWLQGPSKRSKCLFVEAGREQLKFDDVLYENLEIPPIPPDLPIPPLPSPFDPGLQQKLTDGANKAIADLEDRDVINRALVGSPGDDRRFSNTMRVLAVIAAVVTFVLLFRLTRSRRHEPNLSAVPKDTGRIVGSGAAGSVARRKEEILQAGNYAPIVREYLHDLFVDRGWDPASPVSKTPPTITFKGSEDRAIREKVRILWGVVFEPADRAITYTRWKELEPMIDVVQQAAAEDRWRFAPSGGIA